MLNVKYCLKIRCKHQGLTETDRAWYNPVRCLLAAYANPNPNYSCTPKVLTMPSKLTDSPYDITDKHRIKCYSTNVWIFRPKPKRLINFPHTIFLRCVDEATSACQTQSVVWLDAVPLSKAVTVYWLPGLNCGLTTTSTRRSSEPKTQYADAIFSNNGYSEYHEDMQSDSE